MSRLWRERRGSLLNIKLLPIKYEKIFLVTSVCAGAAIRLTSAYMGDSVNAVPTKMNQRNKIHRMLIHNPREDAKRREIR